MSTPQPQAVTERPTWNLDSPELYLNGELTWLGFKGGVLNEAEDERTPLLERLKFVAIVSANLDEFFMKRIGGLKQQRGAGVSSLTVDGRTPEQQIAEANRVVRELEARVTAALDTVLGKLEEHDIRIVDYASLPQGDRTYLREHFLDNIFPLMTPQAIDPAHPFPFLSNLSLNLLVTVRLPGELGRISLARIKVPVGGDVPRFLKLHDVNHFVPLEQVVIHNMDMLLDIRHIFEHARNSREFVLSATNLDLSHRTVLQARKQHTAETIANRYPKTALEWFNDEFSIGSRQQLVVTYNTAR